MSLRINDTAPDFTAETTQGTIHFHDWIGDGWAVLFSHPKAFTRICTSELASLAATQSDYVNRGVQLIGVGPDPVSSQRALAVANNVVIDVAADSYTQADPAVNIARQIAARVPTT